MNETLDARVDALLRAMTLEEKIRQLTGEMLFDVDEDYDERRNPLCGSYRNPGHFMHQTKPASPAAVTARINKDMEASIAAQPHGIPPLENGEALHGAQWGMATNFPQPISLASSFDPALVGRVGDAIGKECSAVGVRQVFSPVVNVVRDCRWGRTVETYGEDVKLTCDMGAAMCRGLQQNGVIATPKHFVDNYAAGGRDSNYSDTAERTLREVFLPPFRACFDAGAQSVMAAYNSWDGVPCMANRRLLTDILRGEWGFSGFVVSDYWGVEGLHQTHQFAASEIHAMAQAIEAGLDVVLPFDSFEKIRAAAKQGLLSEEAIDRAARRVLRVKLENGLFDDPLRDGKAADALVRCDAHRLLALEAARAGIVLLKNDGVLPLQKENIKRIGVFGQSADLIPIGTNYAGPYNAPWQGDDAPTPLQALRSFLGAGAEVLYADSDKIETLAPQCDAVLYFTTIVEGEGSDRSDLRLPSITRRRAEEGQGGLIVDRAQQSVREDQEAAIARLCKANRNTIVVLLNGAPIDMTAWIAAPRAVLEAWYPGEQGAKALAEILFGETNPSAKLPISIPKHAGQLPLFYARKPSGRGYAYCDDDGKPLYPFGFGLSYTTFAFSNAALTLGDDGPAVSFDLTNTGAKDGAEVAQLYVGSRFCGVVRPQKELKAYEKVFLRAGETKRVTLRPGTDAFCYYDAQMRYGLHDGCHTLLLGASSERLPVSFGVRVQDGRFTADTAAGENETNN